MDSELTKSNISHIRKAKLVSAFVFTVHIIRARRQGLQVSLFSAIIHDINKAFEKLDINNKIKPTIESLKHLLPKEIDALEDTWLDDDAGHYPAFDQDKTTHLNSKKMALDAQSIHHKDCYIKCPATNY